MAFRTVPARSNESVPEWVSDAKDGCHARGDRPDIKYPLKIVNGTYQIPLQEATKDLIRSFETRDSDVFVCTFAKSGTTWTQHIINLLLNEGGPVEKNYTEAVPWLESLTFGGVDQEPPELHHEAENWTLDALRSTPDRRFMKSHAKLKDLPAGTAEGLKVIYVARNPKDVCVSLFHHASNKKKHPFVGDFSDMLGCFVKGGWCPNGPWFDHILGWWEAAKADPEHVLFLHYEQMLKDPQAHVQMIADFAGINCTPEILAKTVAGSSLSAMKGDPKANIRPSTNRLRKGGAGGWRDSFTVRQSEAFDKVYRQQMKGSGLNFDFGEGLVM